MKLTTISVLKITEIVTFVFLSILFEWDSIITSNVHNNKAQKLITYNSKNCKSFQAEVQINK